LHQRLTALHGTQLLSFFFQAEDGIRDSSVTGVQTCALPISSLGEHEKVYLVLAQRGAQLHAAHDADSEPDSGRLGCLDAGDGIEIGRASCRERGEIEGGAVGVVEGTSGEVGRGIVRSYGTRT